MGKRKQFMELGPRGMNRSYIYMNIKFYISIIMHKKLLQLIELFIHCVNCLQ